MTERTAEACERSRPGVPSSLSDQVHSVIRRDRDALALPFPQTANVDVPGVLPISGDERLSPEKRDPVVGPKRDPLAVGRRRGSSNPVALHFVRGAGAAHTFEPHGRARAQR